MNKTDSIKIEIPNLLILVATYMCLQYLFVPIVTILLSGKYPSESFYLSIIGIIFFILGFLLANRSPHTLKLTKINENIDINIFKYAAIICLSLGIFIKLKSCIPIAVGGSCDNFLNAIRRPNLLYYGSITFFSIYLILLSIFEKNKNLKKLYFLYLFIISAGFLAFIMISGVGRTLSISYIISIILIIYSIDKKFRGYKYITGGIFFIFFIWVLISFFKEYLFEAKDLETILNKNFLMVKVVNRISQSHIFAAIYEIWPKDSKLYFYGIMDFFTMPSIGIERQMLDGNGFGRVVKIINDNDFITGIAPTFIGDLYIRGGILYIAFGMLIIGFFYGTVQYLLKSSNNEIKLTFIALIFPFLIYGTEDYIFLSISTVIIMSIFYLLVLNFSKKIKSIIK